MRRRVLTILLAVLLAVAGTVGVLAYVRQANTRAIAGLETVSVLVVNQPIPAGTTASEAKNENALISQRMPVSSVPSDAVRAITSTNSNLVTSSALQPGELLLGPMLVSQSQITGALAIPPGMVAVTMLVCLPEDVAGFVQAGSEVAVFNTHSPQKLDWQHTCEITRPVQADGTAFTTMVVPKIKVLSVSQSNSSGSSSSSSSGVAALADGGSDSQSTTAPTNGVMVTFAATQFEAEQLILIQEAGLPYLALLTPTTKVSPSTISNANGQ